MIKIQWIVSGLVIASTILLASCGKQPPVKSQVGISNSTYCQTLASELNPGDHHYAPGKFSPQAMKSQRYKEYYKHCMQIN